MQQHSGEAMEEHSSTRKPTYEEDSGRRKFTAEEDSGRRKEEDSARRKFTAEEDSGRRKEEDSARRKFTAEEGSGRRKEEDSARRKFTAEEGSGRRKEEDSARRKATAMSKQEMVYMVSILEKKDYDCKEAEYSRPNTRKNNILDIVIQGLGVTRSKDQLRKRWSDLKLREREQLLSIRRIIKKKQKRKKLLWTRKYSRGSASSSVGKPDPPESEDCEKDDREENNDSDDTVTIDPLEQSKTYATSDATENPVEELSDTSPSSPCILLTSTEEYIAPQKLLYLYTEGQPDVQISEEFSIAAATKNSQNILGDIEKCKQILANIKKSVNSLETTLENICKKVSYADE
ncbi:vicilin-like seed storage protein At2g18540 [Xenopus laevis]|uniref:Vicilin-like seed storage protein At2g18540 n=1 Tax=Xenopus laevis TaxID=8355 RepID=A0A8J0U759_XENLA|nr:vicilin-like seed storage protein At2g18540 [Xenopus laevis]